MQRVILPGTGLEASSLGFGCASLGSRVSARDGLAALAAAHDAGVTWFDLAPAYGAGEAETIFAPFLRTRRDSIRVLTKVGLAPPAWSGLLRTAYAALRPVSGALRALKGRTGATLAQNRAVPITAALIETSIASSLKRLGTDHVDVLALHDPDPSVVGRDDVVAALERVLQRGQARAVGVAGSFDACLAAASMSGLPYRVLQTAVGPESTHITDLRRRVGPDFGCIGHSVMRSRSQVDAGTTLSAALAANSQGITLVSMFDRAHLRANLDAARDAASLPRSEAVRPMEIAR